MIRGICARCDLGDKTPHSCCFRLERIDGGGGELGSPLPVCDDGLAVCCCCCALFLLLRVAALLLFRSKPVEDKSDTLFHLRSVRVMLTGDGAADPPRLLAE